MLHFYIKEHIGLILTPVIKDYPTLKQLLVNYV